MVPVTGTRTTVASPADCARAMSDPTARRNRADAATRAVLRVEFVMPQVDRNQVRAPAIPIGRTAIPC